MRYFYINYSVKDKGGSVGLGATLATTEGMFNNNKLVQELKEGNKNLDNVFVLSWVEMSEEDYLQFTDKGWG